MGNATKTPRRNAATEPTTDYSNESFERFQKRLKSDVGGDSPRWQLRDALFAEAYYGKSWQLAFFIHCPGDGW